MFNQNAVTLAKSVLAVSKQASAESEKEPRHTVSLDAVRVAVYNMVLTELVISRIDPETFKGFVLDAICTMSNHISTTNAQKAALEILASEAVSGDVLGITFSDPLHDNLVNAWVLSTFEAHTVIPESDHEGRAKAQALATLAAWSAFEYDLMREAGHLNLLGTLYRAAARAMEALRESNHSKLEAIKPIYELFKNGDLGTIQL